MYLVVLLARLDVDLNLIINYFSILISSYFNLYSAAIFSFFYYSVLYWLDYLTIIINYN